MIRSFSVSMNNIKEKSAACHRTIHLRKKSSARKTQSLYLIYRFENMYFMNALLYSILARRIALAI